jgi:hypothetical protein
VAALGALLKEEKDEDLQYFAVRSLRSFGPHAWTALPALRELLTPRDKESYGSRVDGEAVALLGCFDPPPVEFLAGLLEDSRSSYLAGGAAVEQLGALRPRARLALPSLRRALRMPKRLDGAVRLVVAEAILAIDPEGGPALAAPRLLQLAKELSSHERYRAQRLLGRCGAAARPSLPALLAALDPKDSLTKYVVDSLAPLLTPKDRKLLPAIRRVLGKGETLILAKVLLRLGQRREALEQAARCLKSQDGDLSAAAARWLGQPGREAQPVEPALRRALQRATGAERARLALTLWQVRGANGTAARTRALAALADLLSLCEGTSPAVGPIPLYPLWDWSGPYASDQEDEAVGAAVALVLGRVDAGDKPVAVLAPALRDKSPHVRLVAAVALSRAEPGHADTVPALRRLLERYPHFFRYTADTLAALGPRAAPLAHLLLPYLRQSNEYVFRAADRVLRRIDPALAAKGWGAAGVPGAVPADFDPLWKDLAQEDAFRADLAAWRLAGAGPRAVALLRKHLRPPPGLAPKRTARLIKDLDSDDFDTREHASAALEKVLDTAAPALRRARASAPPEARARLDRLLAGLDQPRPPQQRRRLRALRLLEEMGGPEGRALLKRLSRADPRTGLAWEDAAAALRRLDRR